MGRGRKRRGSNRWVSAALARSGSHTRLSKLKGAVVNPEEQTPEINSEDLPMFPEPEKEKKNNFIKLTSGKRVDKEIGTNPNINNKYLSSMKELSRLGGIIKRKTRRRRKPRKKKSLNKRKETSKKKRVRRKRKSMRRS